MKRREPPRRAWLVEKHGRTFARLENPTFLDMFWERCEVIDLTLTDADGRELFSKGFWHEGPLPLFRESRSGAVSPHSFAGGHTPTRDEPWVAVRSLHVPAPRAPQTWLGPLASWIRRRFTSGSVAVP